MIAALLLGLLPLTAPSTPSASAAAPSPSPSPDAEATGAPDPPRSMVRLGEAGELTLQSGLGEGLLTTVGDDLFRFQLRGRVQVRTDLSGSADDDEAVSFFVRRLRLRLSGDALKRKVSWSIQLSFAPRDLESDNPIVVRDATVGFNPTDFWRVRVGQMKVPFDRQRMTSSADLQFPERTAAMNELTLDRDVGVVMFSEPLWDLVEYQVGVFGGDGRNRANGDLGVLATARLQLTPLGAFGDDLVEGDPLRDPTARLAIAIAAGGNFNSPRDKSTTGVFRADERVDYAHATADVLFKKSGLSLHAALLLRTALAERGADPTAIARSAAGGYVQAGIMVTDHLEVVGRYGHLEPLDLGVDNAVDLVREEEIRAAFNVYVFGHDLKLSNDLGVALRADRAALVELRCMAQVAF